jgi:hypothetical protein
MSGDPGDEPDIDAQVEVKPNGDDEKLYPYLSSLNPAQLKGE